MYMWFSEPEIRRNLSCVKYNKVELMAIKYYGAVWIVPLRCAFTFSVLFFYFYAFCFRQRTIIIVHVLNRTVHTSHTVTVLFTYLKILKMSHMVLFIYLKIILLQCFQFSVFNFNKNKLYLNEPIIYMHI